MSFALLRRISPAFTFAPVSVALAITVAVGACTTTTIVERPADGGSADAGEPEPEPELDAAPPPDAADAAPVEGPRKRVFVSSKVTRGAMGGTAGGDALCQAAADAAKLGGKFRALLATDAAVSTKPLAEVGPYYLVDGKTKVTPTVNKLAGVIEHPIDMTETGKPVEASRVVWTGALANCGNWATTNPYVNGTVGLASSLEAFGNHDSRACTSESASLYCFEQ